MLNECEQRVNLLVNNCEQTREFGTTPSSHRPATYNEGMIALPTWLAVYFVLGTLLGALVVGIACFFAGRARRKPRSSARAFYIPPESVIGVLPTPAVMFDADMQPLFQNSAYTDNPDPVKRILRKQWLRRMVSQAMVDGNPISRPSDLDNQESIHILPLPGRRVVVLVSNESQQYQAESLRQDFIANASHELNTPVSAILLLSEAIEMRTRNDKKTSQFVHSLHQEAERLASLTRDIARLAAAQQGVRDTPKAGCKVSEVASVIEGVLDSRRALADSVKVQLVFEKSPEMGDERVAGQKKPLAVAVENLVENAIQHSRTGGAVHVRLSPGGTPVEPVIQIQVADQGEGISSEHIGQIFQRFYRTDNSRARRSGGTGLGLSIARNTARSMGGEVTVISEVGDGSTFTLTVPIAEPAEAAENPGINPGIKSEENG